MSRRPARSLLALSSLALWACSSPAPTSTAAAPAKAEPAKVEPVEDAGDPSLPAELTDEDLREVLDPLKTAVRQTCNGIDRASERIEVELTISGKSGAVSHTVVRHDGGNPPLGACVAKELARGIFKKVRKGTTRTVVAINF
jgi:hypothetical protein